MTLRVAFLFLILLGAGGLAPTVNAHSPFDASVRTILHDEVAELNVTVGTTLGETFLRDAQIDARRLPAGQLFVLPTAQITNFFTVANAGTELWPIAASVITDGLEYQFHFEFPLAPPGRLQLRARFLPALPSPQAAAVVATDENGNVLGSAILSRQKDTAEFALPAPAAPLLASERLKVESVEPPTLNPEPKTLNSKPPTPASAFTEFLKLGVSHILNLEAFDHLLFLVALLLGCQRLKPMLLVITGFTLAHSLTLALAALGIVSLSARVVEPLIAVSILVVAVENFSKSETTWPRYALTAGFGFIHGFAFAGILRESGLSGTGWAMAKPLFAFNLGVELGQLAVAAVILPLLLGLNRWPWFARHGSRSISAVVILVAAVWIWQRLTA